MTNLFLFDLDSTLVDLTQVHVKAYQKSFKETFNSEVPKETLTKHFGKTETNLHRNVCEDMSISFSQDQISNNIKTYHKNLTDSLTKDNIIILPGVIEFLKKLKEENNLLGIVTGNAKEVGSLILNESNLMQYFNNQSYGDNANERIEIVREAIKKAEQSNQRLNKIIVIGDTPADIQAALQAEAISIGVATGRFSTTDLKNEGATLTLNSLEEYNKILELANLLP